jgi:hypothetical protein
MGGLLGLEAPVMWILMVMVMMRWKAIRERF